MTSLRVLTYNIRYGGAGREDLLISTINAGSPDVVLLQEATRAPVVDRLAAGTGMAQWATFRRQSLGFMSRHRVEHYEWHQPRFSRHAFLEVVPAATDVRLFGVHLSAVHAAWTERRRVIEVRALLKGIKHYQTGFHVLAGDFNTLAPGEVLDRRRLPPRLRPFVWLSGGRIRWRTIQEVLDAGYIDAFRLKHANEPGFTFPAADPHLRLDYAFVPDKFADRLLKCDVLCSANPVPSSDHLPLLAELRL